MSRQRGARLVRLVRRRRWIIPFAVVFAVAVLLTAWFVAGLSRTSYHVTSGLVESPEPGIFLPEVYFTLNYSGFGYGSFTYAVTFNSTDGAVHVQRSTILVSSVSGFKYVLFEQWPSNATLSARVQVYRSAPSGSYSLVYDKTIYLGTQSSK